MCATIYRRDQTTESSKYDVIFTVAQIFCGLTAFFMVYVIHSDKRLMQHPGSLVSLICMYLGGFILSINFDERICAFKLDELFANSVYPFVKQKYEWN